MRDDGCYAGSILMVDLSSGRISRLPTSDYAGRFVGGRGLAAKLYWDLVPPKAGAFDPENCVIFATGPVAGIGGLAGSRCQIVTKSPVSEPQQYCYGNIGGHWGTQLKFAGYDGLVVTSAADKPVYLLIRDDAVEIRDASHLWQKGAIEVREAIKQELGRDVRVVATGPAGDNRVSFATIHADNDANGSAGAGAVLGSKMLKAIVVRGTGKVQAADPERLRELVKHVRRLKQRPPGTIEKAAPKGSRFKREACFGCIGSCTSRLVYEAVDGTRGKQMCQSSNFYKERARRYYGEVNEVPFFATQLCDNHGLDTLVIETTLIWLLRCQRAGILDDENTGLPLSKAGSLEFIEALVKQITYREGIGEVLAQGLMKAAETIGRGTPELITDYVMKGGQSNAYGPRWYITSGLLYAMEPRKPIQALHEMSRLAIKWVNWHKGAKDAYMSSELFRRIAKRFWGSEEGADFSTYEGKALAAKMIQDRQYAKECLILCDYAWPITDVECSDDHLGDPTVESKIFSAVTGREVDEAGLYEIGERVFNLQRAVLAREGHLGRESDRIRDIFFTTPLRAEASNPDCWAPGKDGEPFQKTGTVVDREKFEQMKSELYQLRGWDPSTGLQTAAQLRRLDLADLTDGLEKAGALA